MIVSDHTNHDMQDTPASSSTASASRPRNASRISMHARPFLVRPHPHPLAPPLSPLPNQHLSATIPQPPACPSPPHNTAANGQGSNRSRGDTRGRARGAGVRASMHGCFDSGSGRNSVGGDEGVERLTGGLRLGERWSCAAGERGSWDGRQFLCKRRRWRRRRGGRNAPTAPPPKPPKIN